MSLQLDTFNPRVMAVQPSATLAMTARAKQLRREGKPVISLSAGEPDFDTPAPIAEAAIQAIREGFTHYTENAGMLELREAICRKLAEENGLTYEPDQILCTNGAKQAVAMAIEVLCRPEDEVLIPAPYWVSYPEMVRLAGATPVILPTSVETGYRLTPEQLEAAITERTRLLILCSPSNPTGTVYTPEELEALADVLRRHEHVYVLSDEIYEYILFDAKHVSFASLPGMKERTITVNGFSKGFAMTGWRLGYLAAERPIVKAAAKVQSQFTSAPCSISQKAGLAALQMDKGPIREMVAAFRQRRDFVLERLQAIDGITCPKPEGAFYLFPQVSAFYGRRTPDGRTITDSESLCLYLLEQCHVALVPGQAFGDPNGVRISYAASMENLAEAMRRIEAGLAALQ
ncbi:pyridoxal phosphate-dependent aminotransferase [Rhodothermus marinus]|uniref:pyridoxal phosphate-dependent aminotransferase n=1 Tax=Rhodothermus marinus TaxID=29549 RepID=UPI0006D1441B|nr:pyridoxal phosphate-dependent aminotransferase [Rhodothermus marinus]